MNHAFIQDQAKQLGRSVKSIENTLALFDAGATLPFVARYRKEVTGEMNETELESLLDRRDSYLKFTGRKESILKLLKEKGIEDPKLIDAIKSAQDSVSLEDLYAPYKSARVTRGQKAEKAGLAPVANRIMKGYNGDVHAMASPYRCSDFKEEDDVLQGASDIIAERIAGNIGSKQTMRNLFAREAVLVTKAVKAKQSEPDAHKYRDFFQSEHRLNKLPSHRFLAIQRAQKEGFIRVKVSPDPERAINNLERYYIRTNSDSKPLMQRAIADAWKRLLQPSLETEFLNDAKLKADTEAIRIFTGNLSEVLMQAPVGTLRTLAIDPGFRTGCKLVCLSESGDLLHNETIYPHEPRKQEKQAIAKISYLTEAFKIEAIAIGNGTAGRETERLIKRIRFKSDVKVFVVNEAGASIYSASKIGRAEFPNYDVTVRGAVSIGRRLQDPLSELVKIDPKSIGIGQYQHDVNQTALAEGLNRTVESIVNRVGVSLNNAGSHLLQHISGLGPALAQNIVDYRSENGLFTSRAQLKKVPKLGAKAFEQCAGFLRVTEGTEPLDATGIHPERYALVKHMAKKSGVEIKDLIANASNVDKLGDLNQFVNEQIGLPTLTDIAAELKKPGRDPRKKAAIFEFDPKLRTINDVSEGVLVPGIVQNVTNFGAFVNIGIKENGLIHISQMADEFISDPSSILRVEQQIMVRVIEVDLNRKRIALSLRGLNKA